MSKSIFKKLKLISILVLFLSVNSKANYSPLKDSLRLKVASLVSRLDSLSKVDSTIDLNPSNKFDVFKALVKSANEKELFFLVKNHTNPAIKGYAYLGLLIADNKNADAVYKKNFSPVKILLNDVLRIYNLNQSEAFINYVYKKRLRLKSAVYNANNNLMDDSEKSAIKGENKLREEQNIPKVVVPH